MLGLHFHPANSPSGFAVWGVYMPHDVPCRRTTYHALRKATTEAEHIIVSGDWNAVLSSEDRMHPQQQKSSLEQQHSAFVHDMDLHALDVAPGMDRPPTYYSYHQE